MNSEMQAVLILPLSPTFKFSYSPLDLDEFASISENFAGDSKKRLKIDFNGNLKMEDENLKNEVVVQEKQGVHVDKKDKIEEKKEEEFSFDCMNSSVPMVSAEDVFVNGMIRPMFPIITKRSNGGSPVRSPMKKLFIQPPNICDSWLLSTKSKELNGASQGPYSMWQGKYVVDTSLEKCKKSNSTRFSKLWRFCKLLHRSKSDRKDAFVFLNPPASKKVNIKTEKTNSGEAKNDATIKARAPNGVKVKSGSTANEKYYLMNKAKRETDKRRSYLPYKLGFCTYVNGMNKNVHPF